MNDKQKMSENFSEKLKDRFKDKQLKKIQFFDTDIRFAQFILFLYNYQIKLGDFFRSVITACNEKDEDFWKWLNKHKSQNQNRVGKVTKQIKKEIETTSELLRLYSGETLHEEEINEIYSILEMENDTEEEW